jgi:hypothetical protein
MYKLNTPFKYRAWLGFGINVPTDDELMLRQEAPNGVVTFKDNTDSTYQAAVGNITEAYVEYSSTTLSQLGTWIFQLVRGTPSAYEVLSTSRIYVTNPVTSVNRDPKQNTSGVGV